ncbi:PD-(D/E)XK nuclease family protein [Pseudomonas sp. 6D_7.1_Bac1]|uniref:PDDEXK-like family protein n=1 Tax=Pseudomonas sp. 6D_7.1_Bac1 TaxID=2971615 RepID=UPI0021CA6AC7|nr:PD-(D/E)XK nuclease family protein [Pseudomonas sp. 6D_7.1_Bac1]MCU1752206.1 PD-(D/E)XK nuclease family protein [Pseudomonas sp. 6D_7.1_Bac1]
MHPLINQAALLRAKHHRPPGFNLFTLLRSASDEVRLHSRYLAFLLDPDGAHAAGGTLLKLLLEALNIEGFDCQSATVEVEYRKIDILIRNAKGQALIIENKIHAGDQDGQLYGYLKTLESEGYQTFAPLYLTLDGSDADTKSCRGIDYQRVSYATDILPWLERCQLWVIREAAVRESLLQYIDLVRKLTFKDQGQKYMDMLKQTLLKDNNLVLVRDLQKAFIETLKDLQLILWQAVARRIEEKYPELSKPYVIPTPANVDRYYTNAKGNKNFGLYYELGFMPGAVYIELNHRFYCGYYCDVSSHAGHYKRLERMTTLVQNNGTSSNGLLWRYTTELDMKNPSDENLMMLTDPDRRERAAERMADDLHDLWRKAREFCPEPGLIP